MKLCDAQGKVVLITGAGQNLGREMALALLKAKANVVLTALTEDPLLEVVSAAGEGRSRALSIAGDISQQADRALILKAAFERFGRVDMLVNNAAVTPETYWPDWLATGEPRQWEISDEFYRHFLEVDSVAPHVFMAALIPGMIERGWGRIVNVTTSLDTMLAFWPYGSAKAALEAQTAVLAGQLAGTGVTANVLIPGGFAKPGPLHLSTGQIVKPALKPTIMAAPVCWLASTQSDGISARRILAAKWNAEESPEKSWQAATFPIAWSEYGERAVSPSLEGESRE